MLEGSYYSTIMCVYGCSVICKSQITNLSACECLMICYFFFPGFHVISVFGPVVRYGKDDINVMDSAIALQLSYPTCDQCPILAMQLLYERG